MSFSVRVREELAHAPLGPSCCRTAETAALLRLGGALHLSGEGAGWIVTLRSAAATRRLHAELTRISDVRPQIEVHQPTGLDPTRYRLLLRPPATGLLRHFGVLDDDGHLRETVPSTLLRPSHDAAAFLRGAFLAAGSISDPQRSAHLEIRIPTEAIAGTVREALRRCGGDGARAGQRADGWRVSCKSGAAIGVVLARMGAHAAFLEWDDARLRRELRAEANRATNADEANLSRAAGAAARQVAAIEAVLAQLGWDGVPDELRPTALARLANPEASLGELGALHDPPVGKATVHRRLARLAAMAAPAPAKGPPGPE